MAHRIETTGASVQEALDRALGELEAKRAEVNVDILDPGSSGLFGIFGGRQARVRVERLIHKHDDLRALMVDVLQSMDIDGEVNLHRDEDITEVQIRTDGLDGLLIGRRGQTLAALQHVFSRLASKEFGQDGHLVVDVGDYRKRREAHLIDKAQALAEKVRVTGREISLEPLHAPDRRVVHLAIADMIGVRSYTVGQGLHRNVVIAPDLQSE